nr:hypothetical protein [Pseudomonas sp. PS01303]
MADDTTFDDRTGLFDVGAQHILGTNYMAETGYETHFNDEVKPRYYRFGVSYLDARRSDVLLSTEGRKRWKHSGSPKTQRGETAIYLTGGQVLLRPDVWARQWRQRRACGDGIVVRYADDSVVGFRTQWQAQQFRVQSQERLARFGLSLNASKTRLIEFGRFAVKNRRRRGLGKPETFDFQGSTALNAALPASFTDCPLLRTS